MSMSVGVEEGSVGEGRSTKTETAGSKMSVCISVLNRWSRLVCPYQTYEACLLQTTLLELLLLECRVVLG